jgi:hypothetical protein
VADRSSSRTRISDYGNCHGDSSVDFPHLERLQGGVLLQRLNHPPPHGLLTVDGRGATGFIVDTRVVGEALREAVLERRSHRREACRLLPVVL